MRLVLKNKEEIFARAENDFEALALDIFRHQAVHCEPYKRFLSLLDKNPDSISSLPEIPFLPIEFFKSERIITRGLAEEAIFTSSGTSGTNTSQHFVADLSLYQATFTRAFEMYYGPVSEWAILALLPSYLERSGSSLVYMCDHLIQSANADLSGFFLHDFQQLKAKLEKAKRLEQKTMLIGVTFALLDFAESHPFSFPELVVMETGGMKGRRQEMTREEVHSILKTGFGVPSIHSEYGMTELLSQAYSQGNGIFTCPPWMRLYVRDTEDPFSYVKSGQSGGINIIDLANLNGCSFIATQDLGRKSSYGSFEVLGRFDHSDVRGCNLMAL